MTIIYVIIIIILAVMVILLWGRGRETTIGICNYALDRTVRKSQNKQKIIALFESGVDLSNSDIRKRLGFADRTVVRYMDDLEREGKVKQIGGTGRGVVYRTKG